VCNSALATFDFKARTTAEGGSGDRLSCVAVERASVASVVWERSPWPRTPRGWRTASKAWKSAGPAAAAFLYDQIGAGLLKAHKLGRKTVVLVTTAEAAT